MLILNGDEKEEEETVTEYRSRARSRETLARVRYFLPISDIIGIGFWIFMNYGL